MSSTKMIFNPLINLLIPLKDTVFVEHVLLYIRNYVVRSLVFYSERVGHCIYSQSVYRQLRNKVNNKHNHAGMR